jgi:hypothetical protein
MGMKESIAKTIVERLYDEGASDDDVSLYDGYSGRGMHGERTAGIVCDSLAQLYKIGIAAGWLEAQAEAEDGAFEAPRNLRTDSLGRDIIVY